MQFIEKNIASVVRSLRIFIRQLFHSREHQLLLILFLFIFFCFFVNTFHESYPDEFDNILGGKLILDGILPYTGFFSHHGPVAYLISAIISLFSGASFVKFRIFYSIFLFLYFLGIYIFFRKRFGVTKSGSILFLITAVSLAGVYMWSHMLLADNLAAIFLTPVFAFLLFLRTNGQRLQMSDVAVISVLIGLGVLSSLTFSYLSVGIYGYILFLYVREYGFSFLSKRFLIFCLLLASPYMLFLFYLLLVGGLFEYYHDAIAFNQKYYIYNYPRPEGSTSTSINPIRYAIIISYTFFENFTNLLSQTKDFNLQFPLNITLAFGNVALIIYLFFTRKWDFALFLIFVLIFANTRSNPLNSKETDYQAAVYMMISFFNIGYLLPRLYNDANKSIDFVKKITFLLLFICLSIYVIFSAFYLIRNFSGKAYAKYMGTAPLIYDRPHIAPMMNLISGTEGYIWIGPFEYEEMLYVTGKIPTKYHVLLPGIGRSPEMQQEMLAELEKQKPEVIWFDKNFHILGYRSGDYGKFFTDFLESNYTTFYESRDTGIVYKSVPEITEKMDIETMLYIRKDKFNEVAEKLQDNNYITLQD